MTLSAMLYAVVFALMLAGAAHFLDRGFRALGRPTRWIWAAAMLGGVLAPFLPRLMPTARPVASTGGLGIPLETLYGIGAMGTAGSAGTSSLIQMTNGSLAGLWILGSILVAGAFASVCLRLRRQRTAWEVRTVGGEEVLLSKGLGPAVMGVFRPRIILPPWALSLSRDELELVLLHEKEHVQARDPALLAGGLLMAALTPWNPVLWWSLQRLRLAVEGDCDRRVLARGIAPSSYGRFLLGMASRGQRLPALAPALTEGGKTFMEKRLMMIQTLVSRHRSWAAVSGLAAAAVFLVLACETPLPPGDAAEENLDAVAAEAAQEGRVVRLRPNKLGEEGEAELKPLVFVDGVRFPGPDLSAVDADDIERIEVIKGKDAVDHYGPEAAAGVILIFTTKR
jgi:beta-lactamase regulating signal transducer with metallopeptidase domain